MKSFLKTWIVWGALIALVLIPFFLFGEDLERFAQVWIDCAHEAPWLCGSVLGLLLAGDIILPIPSSLASTACGIALGWFWGTIVSMVGMSISMIAGYSLMRLGAPWIRKRLGDALVLPRDPMTAVCWVVALRPVPVLAEASILGAGLAELSWRGVFIGGTIANLLISFVYAILGTYLQDGWLFVVAFGGVMALSGIALFVLRKRLNKVTP